MVCCSFRARTPERHLQGGSRGIHPTPHLTPTPAGCGRLPRQTPPPADTRQARGLLLPMVRKGFVGLNHPDWRPETSFLPASASRGGLCRPREADGHPPACLPRASPGSPPTASEPATWTHCLSGQEGELPGASRLRGKGPPTAGASLPRNDHSGVPRAKPHTPGTSLQPIEVGAHRPHVHPGRRNSSAIWNPHPAQGWQP